MNKKFQEQAALHHHIRHPDFQKTSDMGKILDIEDKCSQSPWNEEDFTQELRPRNCMAMVAEQGDDNVTGFIIYTVDKGHINIIKLAVHPDHQKTGVGKAMIDTLQNKLSHQNQITLEVRETNLAAQLFFKSIGFKAISVERNFYEDTGEDAYLMQREYEPAPTPEQRKKINNRIAHLLAA